MSNTIYRALCSCTICKSEITTNNLNHHYNSKSCKRGGTHATIHTTLHVDEFICPHCNKDCTTKQSVIQHALRCSKNPEKIKIHHYNGMLGKTHSIETKKKIGVASSNRSPETIEKLRISSTGKVWTLDQKDNHSIRMKQAVKNNPDSYSSGNQGRVKTYIIDGIKLKGKWEVDFYLWCKNNNIKVDRPDQGFYYYWNGHRTYFPDFYLPEYNQYVEIKGYQTERDNAKWLYFPYKLKVLKEKEIKLIRNNTYSL